MLSIRADILVASKREVEILIRLGRIMTPKEAWMMSGHVKDQQTLWSVASHIAARHECSAEALNRYLEHHFPQFANETQHIDWEEMKRKDANGSEEV